MLHSQTRPERCGFFVIHVCQNHQRRVPHRAHRVAFAVHCAVEVGVELPLTTRFRPFSLNLRAILRENYLSLHSEPLCDKVPPGNIH